MTLPFRALLDPFADGGDLGVGEGGASLWRRHAGRFIRGADAGEEAAVGRVAGADDVVRGALGEEPFVGIEPEVGDAALVVGAVACEAVVRENGADVAVEIDGL